MIIGRRKNEQGNRRYQTAPPFARPTICLLAELYIVERNTIGTDAVGLVSVVTHSTNHKLGPCFVKHDVIHKTGSMYRIATVLEEDQATAIGKMYKIWWSLHVRFWDMQANRQTDILVTIPYSPLDGGKVIKTCVHRIYLAFCCATVGHPGTIKRAPMGLVFLAKRSTCHMCAGARVQCITLTVNIWPKISTLLCNSICLQCDTTNVVRRITVKQFYAIYFFTSI